MIVQREFLQSSLVMFLSVHGQTARPGIAGFAASPVVFPLFVDRLVVVAARVVDYGSGTCHVGFDGVDTPVGRKLSLNCLWAGRNNN